MTRPQSSADHEEARSFVSPFAHTEASIPSMPQRQGPRFAWIGAIAISLVTAGVIAIFVLGYVNDPYRTLEPFPVAKYFEGHGAVAGAKFRGEMRVEADLGWKEDIGRLMLFTTEGDSRPFAVMIPVAVGQEIYFTKGQTYVSELEVRDGGLIYANSIRKN